MKQTVDSYTHQIGREDARLIIESNFGNDGYSFWFKLK